MFLQEIAANSFQPVTAKDGGPPRIRFPVQLTTIWLEGRGVEIDTGWHGCYKTSRGEKDESER